MISRSSLLLIFLFLFVNSTNACNCISQNKTLAITNFFTKTSENLSTASALKEVNKWVGNTGVDICDIETLTMSENSSPDGMNQLWRYKGYECEDSCKIYATFSNIYFRVWYCSSDFDFSEQNIFISGTGEQILITKNNTDLYFKNNVLRITPSFLLYTVLLCILYGEIDFYLLTVILIAFLIHLD